VTWFVDTALVAAVVGAVAAAPLPEVIGRLPEPEPDPEEHELVAAENEAEFARPVDDPKEPYAELARVPGLRWGLVAACALAAGAVGGRVGWHWSLVYLLYLVPVCAALAVIDWRTRYLPKRLVVPSYAVVGAVVVLAAVVTQDLASLERAVIGWLSAYFFYLLLWFLIPRGMAYGDVRLAGLLGLALGWLGVQQLVLGLYTGFLLGGVLGLLLSALKVFHHRHSPFGPYMVLGAFLGAAFPGQLGEAYGWVVGGLSDGIGALVNAF
jgi:leader peptidase (prepilin peptidase)/N-methyltransferase